MGDNVIIEAKEYKYLLNNIVVYSENKDELKTYKKLYNLQNAKKVRKIYNVKKERCIYSKNNYDYICMERDNKNDRYVNRD